MQKPLMAIRLRALVGEAIEATDADVIAARAILKKIAYHLNKGNDPLLLLSEEARRDLVEDK